MSVQLEPIGTTQPEMLMGLGFVSFWASSLRASALGQRFSRRDRWEAPCLAFQALCASGAGTRTGNDALRRYPPLPRVSGPPGPEVGRLGQ
jgi:hypothetical protein